MQILFSGQNSITNPEKTAKNGLKWLKIRFSTVLKMKKNANFDRLTFTTDCDVIIEHTQNLIISSDSSFNSVPVRVLEHVPQVKIGQNMLFLSLTSFTKQAELSIRKLRAFFQFRTIWHILALYNKFSLDHYMATPSLATLRYLRL